MKNVEIECYTPLYNIRKKINGKKHRFQPFSCHVSSRVGWYGDPSTARDGHFRARVGHEGVVSTRDVVATSGRSPKPRDGKTVPSRGSGDGVVVQGLGAFLGDHVTAEARDPHSAVEGHLGVRRDLPPCGRLEGQARDEEEEEEEGG